MARSGVSYGNPCNSNFPQPPAHAHQDTPPITPGPVSMNNAFHRINIKNKYAFPVNWWFLKQIFGPQINEGSAHASIAAAPETPGLRNIEENINLAPDTADGMQEDDILFEMMRNEGLVSDDSSDEHE